MWVQLLAFKLRPLQRKLNFWTEVRSQRRLVYNRKKKKYIYIYIYKKKKMCLIDKLHTVKRVHHFGEDVVSLSFSILGYLYRQIWQLAPIRYLSVAPDCEI